MIGAFVAVMDPVARAAIGDEVATRRQARPEDCILPRGVATYGDRILLACMGTDTLVELDGRAADPITVKRDGIRVAPGPTGVVVDAKNDRALVASSWAHAVTVVPMGKGRSAELIVLCSRGPRRRRSPCRRSGGGDCSTRCATCGSPSTDERARAATRTAGPTASPGPRPTARGRPSSSPAAPTAFGPFGWFGDHPRMKNHITLTLERLGGHGLDASRADEQDLDALMAYVRSMKLPSREGAIVDEGVEALRARGREIFFADETACSTCHLGDRSDGLVHDVGTGSATEKRRLFATPALRGVAVSAPYFHDGRYATLMDLLSDPTSKMGRSAQLTEGDRRALAAYLESL